MKELTVDLAFSLHHSWPTTWSMRYYSWPKYFISLSLSSKLQGSFFFRLILISTANSNFLTDRAAGFILLFLLFFLGWFSFLWLIPILYGRFYIGLGRFRFVSNSTEISNHCYTWPFYVVKLHLGISEVHSTWSSIISAPIQLIVRSRISSP